MRISEIAEKARLAGRSLGTMSAGKKNAALLSMAKALREQTEKIKDANRLDMAEGKKNDLSIAMLDRLLLDDNRIGAIADGIEQIATLDDPVGGIEKMKRHENGLLIGKMRVPLGVVAIIYESRPNVTADASALCLKSGNCVILRGGSEAINSNRAIAYILGKAVEEAGMPEGVISFVDTTDRSAVLELLQQEKNIDIVVPRGGHGLIRFVTENSLIPVIKHDKGLCHIYVDKYADLEMAKSITINAKASRPGVCNALETLLVHKDIAETFLTTLAKEMDKAGIVAKACENSIGFIPGAQKATDEDWDKEYLDLRLAIKTVENFDSACEHIAKYGSGHTESIVTKDHERAMEFLRRVDSSAVMVNTSTRFNDGGQFGLGAEIGISTQKLHARGPMGIGELTCEKFIVMGNGQIRP